MPVNFLTATIPSNPPRNREHLQVPNFLIHRLTIDPLFPPPYEWPAQKKMQMGENCLEESRYMLIFDEEEEGDELRRMFGEEMGMDIIGGI